MFVSFIKEIYFDGKYKNSYLLPHGCDLPVHVLVHDLDHDLHDYVCYGHDHDDSVCYLLSDLDNKLVLMVIKIVFNFLNGITVLKTTFQKQKLTFPRKTL